MTIKGLLENLNLRVSTVKPTDKTATAIRQIASDYTSAIVVTNENMCLAGVLAGSSSVKHLNDRPIQITTTSSGGKPLKHTDEYVEV